MRSGWTSGRILAGALLAALLAVLTSSGCASPPSAEEETKLLSPTDEQTKLRAYQSRTLEVRSRQQALRGVIAALQDLGFIIERANEPLGLVTAARFAEPRYFDVMGITVTVREESRGKMLVRANAIFNNAPVTDPKVYQNFFATLERSMFLERN